MNNLTIADLYFLSHYYIYVSYARPDRSVRSFSRCAWTLLSQHSGSVQLWSCLGATVRLGRGSTRNLGRSSLGRVLGDRPDEPSAQLGHAATRACHFKNCPEGRPEESRSPPKSWKQELGLKHQQRLNSCYTVDFFFSQPRLLATKGFGASLFAVMTVVYLKRDRAAASARPHVMHDGEW